MSHFRRLISWLKRVYFKEDVSSCRKLPESVPESRREAVGGVISTYFPPDGTHNRQLAGDIIGEGLIALFVELQMRCSLFFIQRS